MVWLYGGELVLMMSNRTYNTHCNKRSMQHKIGKYNKGRYEYEKYGILVHTFMGGGEKIISLD